MSYYGANRLHPNWGKFEMARSEIHRRTLNVFWKIRWKFWLKHAIRINWPTGWTRPEPAPGGGFIQAESSDPNDHFRPWLERNVGKQGRDWDWRDIPRFDVYIMNMPLDEQDLLEIKFRNAEHATLFALTWC